MTRITIPVVAHRMFGMLHGPVGTVWTREPTLSEHPLLLGRRHGFEEEAEAQEGGEVQEGLKPAPYAAYVAPGTRRTVDEIRDLFDGEGRAARANCRSTGFGKHPTFGSAWSRSSITPSAPTTRF